MNETHVFKTEDCQNILQFAMSHGRLGIMLKKHTKKFSTDSLFIFDKSPKSEEYTPKLRGVHFVENKNGSFSLIRTWSLVSRRLYELSCCKDESLNPKKVKRIWFLDVDVHNLDFITGSTKQRKMAAPPTFGFPDGIYLAFRQKIKFLQTPKKSSWRLNCEKHWNIQIQYPILEYSNSVRY